MKLRTHFKGLQNHIESKIIFKSPPFLPLFSFGITQEHGGKVEICIRIRYAYLLCLGSKNSLLEISEPQTQAFQVILSNIKSDCQKSKQMLANRSMTGKLTNSLFLWASSLLFCLFVCLWFFSCFYFIFLVSRLQIVLFQP